MWRTGTRSEFFFLKLQLKGRDLKMKEDESKVMVLGRELGENGCVKSVWLGCS